MGKSQTDLLESNNAHHLSHPGYRKQLAVRLWQAALENCNGESAVKRALADLPDNRAYAILSIGKAAASMTSGAHDALGLNIPSLTITKDGHIDAWLSDLSNAQPNIKSIEAGHPVPDTRSLVAGRAARDFVERLSENTCLIMLVSGGASSLCELLPPGLSLADLQKMTENKLATGATISEINKARSEISLIKRGKIFEAFKGSEVKSYIISDVAGDKIETIGSGIGLYPEALPPGKFAYSSEILKSNSDARNTVEELAKKAGLNIRDNIEKLYGDVFDCAHILARDLKNGENGLYIYGGEPTVELPESPGEGGRSQCLALALAKEVYGCENLTCLIAGTDGTDGPTKSAGGLIDGETYSKPEEAEMALEQANAGAYLRAVNCLYISGPTGTNVMDLAVCIKMTEQEARTALENIN